MSNIEKFKFNPPLGFNDSNAYPNPVDEESVREQLQRPHNQTRDYINRLTTLLEEKGASFIVTSDGKSVEQALKEIAEAQGVSDYKDLSNKPSINGVELNGDASLDDLGLTDAIERSTTEALTEAKESGMFNGSDGYTPVKGEDYFTEEDKDEIANEAIEKIPLASFENYGLVKIDSRTAASDNYVTVTHARDAGRNESYFVPTVKRFNNNPSTLNANFLPVATTDTIGAVKAGNNITIDEDGTINANALDVNLDDYAKKSEIPTKVSAFENDKGYLTEHQSLDEYAKKNEMPEVPTSLSQLTNDSGFITVKDIPEAGEKNVVTNVQSSGGGSADLMKLTTADGNVYYSVMAVGGGSNTIKPSRLPIVTQSLQGAMSKEDKIKLDGIENGANNYTHPTYQVLVETPIESKQLSFGSTFDVVNEIKDNNGHISEIGVERFKLPSIPSEYVTETELNAKGYLTQHQDLSAYAKKSELPTIPTKVSAFENDKGYLTEHQSLSAYSTTAQNDAKYQPKGSYLTSIPSEYVTESELSSKGFAKQSDVTQLSEEIADLKNGVVTVPSYWVSELETKANAIQVAMEKAGRNKSAFLWYTDAHWKNGNAKVSPMLLNYLYKNTPMNKVNFGGDIIGDSLLATREEMKYLYEWRNAIRDLPNHHSVFGNHDMFDSSSVDYENDNYRYAFLLAPEEAPNMVWGNGNYYYIDNPAEKTRYLYLAYLTGNHTAMLEQGNFIVDAIKSVSDGWHIVAIAHRWWQYSSSSTPTTGSVPAYETEILDVFDKYNARTTRSGSNYFTAQDFTSGKGKVEFCIGGHIHVDYDIFSNGGIPIIITTADANQNRVPTSEVDSGTVGTITESAVFGIIADYNEEVTKITVVGVGRGTSRVVRASSVTPKSLSNITYSGDTTVESAIDKSKFAFTVNYSDNSTSQVNGANTVTPTTIATVGNNSVTITYVENGITLSATTTIVGTAKPIVNVFDKNDSDVLLTGRLNSSNNAVAYQEGQLVTGYIEAKSGNTFTIITDKSLKTNGYTGQCSTYNTGKTPIMAFTNANPTWSFSTDGLTGTITIPDTYGGKDNTATTYVRFCVAYTDIDSIVITKS